MKTISLKLPERLHAQLEHAAKEAGEGKSEIVRAALERFLNGRSRGEKVVSAFELAGDLAGSCSGPGDLSTNPKYMQGRGLSRVSPQPPGADSVADAVNLIE